MTTSVGPVPTLRTHSRTSPAGTMMWGLLGSGVGVEMGAADRHAPRRTKSASAAKQPAQRGAKTQERSGRMRFRYDTRRTAKFPRRGRTTQKYWEGPNPKKARDHS